MLVSISVTRYMINSKDYSVDSQFNIYLELKNIIQKSVIKYWFKLFNLAAKQIYYTTY